MIQLHTFGDAMIRVGEKEIRPSAPVLFAALLYLCVERGRRVPRAALQELLFPEKDERSAAHSVRQLLYKLRTLGVPLEMAVAHTALPADSVVEVEEVGGEMLPGYAPQLSAAFADWVARYRSQRLADARSRLLRELTAARSAGDAAATAKLAASLLSIDPLNEEATYAKAEALAVAGQKHQAVLLLQEYGDEVESVSPSLRLPADLLRRRIAERFAEGPRTDPPLLGRAKELAMLLGHFERASSGRATMSLVWGEAGIGKTRLVQEFRAHVSLRKAVVVSTHCQPYDTSRPMGALVDLVPRMLQFRGALGIAPEAMRVLRGLLGSEPLSTTFEPEVVAARVRLALEELVLSIASEAPLVLVVEDAHWQDEASTSFLRSLLPRDCPLHMVLTSRTSDLVRNGTSSHALPIRLESLERPDALQLLQAAVGSRSTISDELRDRCIDLAAGHPLFICSIAEHLRVSATAPSTSTTLRDLLRRRLQALSPHALLLLRCVAAYSNLCTLARARLSLGMPLGEAMLAVQDLAERGLITQDGEIMRCSHDLLAEAVLADMPQATRAAVMEQVAVVLEEEGTTSRQASLLWACAECWVQAGRSSRAASAFRSCAEFAMEIGQSGFAIQAMERAQSRCTEQELEECIEDTIRIADASAQVEAVTRNIDRLNKQRVRLGLPPTDSTLVAFASVNALRRELIPVWSERMTFERLVFDETAMANDRIRAARAFISEAEENLEATACRRFYEQSTAVLRPLAQDHEWRLLEMTFHATFGDFSRVGELARLVIQEHQWRPDRAGLVVFGEAAYLLFKTGELAQAIAVHQTALAEADQLGLDPTHAGSFAERAALIFLYSGDVASGEAYHSLARSIFAKLGDSDQPPHLSNAVEFAIADGNISLAREKIASLRRKYSRYFTPNRERITLGQELIVDWLDGLRTDPEKLERASDLFAKGRTVSECDTLAAGIALSMAADQGGQATTASFGEYLRLWRRDQFPVAQYLRDILDRATAPNHSSPVGFSRVERPEPGLQSPSVL